MPPGKKPFSEAQNSKESCNWAVESHHPSQEDQGAAEDEKAPRKCSGLCKGASRRACSEEEEECNIFPQVEVKNAIFDYEDGIFWGTNKSKKLFSIQRCISVPNSVSLSLFL